MVVKKVLVILILLIAVLPVAAQSTPTVALQLAPDGGLEVRASGYQARVGSDGNLHSLRVGETELLDDKTSFSLGGFFYFEGAKRLGTVTLLASTLERAVVLATDGVNRIEYHFLPSEIRLSLSQSSDKKTLFYLMLSQAVAVAANARTGELAAAPIEEPWTEVTFTAGSGAYLTLRGGDRIWGPLSGRQMWELGPLAPGQSREFSISPGVGEPPKPTPAQLLSLKVEPVNNEQLLGRGQAAQIVVTVENRGEALPEGLLALVLKGHQGEPVAELSQGVAVEERGQAQGRFDLSLPEPGIYSAQVTLSAKERPVKETTVMLAYRPEEIHPTLSIPPDFDSFWGAALAEAKLPAVAPTEFIEDPSRSTAQVKVYRVSYSGAAGAKLAGWLCVPTSEGAHPGLLLLAGYGRPKLEPPIVLAGRGYVTLAAEVVGEGSGTSYIAQGLEDPKGYAYRGIVINALRAFDLLAGRSEVDPQRLAVSGASQGGGVALILAALRPEVAAVAADVPMLCDFPRSVKEGGWPYSEVARYLAAHPDAAEGVWRTLSYFDALNFASRNQRPALLSLGLKDTICRPETIFAVGNYLPKDKEIKVYSEAGHEGGGSAHWIYKLQWLDELLKPAGNPPPTSEPGGIIDQPTQ